MPSFLFPSIKLEEIWEVEFQLSKFFHTSPSSFAEYDYKGFIWHYDRMVASEKNENGNDANVMNFTNPR